MRRATVSLALLILCGCGPNGLIDAQVAARAKMDQSLKDPGSAEYTDVQAYRLSDTNFAFCGKVNAKNGFGGYTGSERFIASPGLALTESSLGDEGRSVFEDTWTRVCDPSKYVQSVSF